MPEPPQSLPLEIDVRAVRQLLDDSADVVVLDCRERDEYDLVHLPQAQLLPMSELAQRAAELEAWRDKRIIVHCHHGGRSLRVTHWLRQNGFTQTQNMSGGIDAWAAEIDPSLPRY